MSIEEVPEGAPVTILSKNEKKARQQILKLGLKEVKGISRVTFKKKGNLIFAIDKPEVYKSAGGSYVVFGECQVEDMNQRYAEAQAAQEAAALAAGSADADAPASKDPASITADLEASALIEKVRISEEEESDEPLDETGLDSADIDLIMEQANVSRNKAIKALRAHDGDMVNAIVDLSS